MKTGIMIREAQVADIPAIQYVRNAVKENRLSDPALVPDKDVADYITRRGKGWVAVGETGITGFSIVSVTDANVWALFVHPDHEGRGAGRRLHDKMLDWYFSQNTATLWLSTSPGTRAESFYRKAGWQEAGVYGKGETRFEMTAYQWKKHQGARSS